MTFNLPVFEEVKNCRHILVAGMGGGFDVFCGLPVYFLLQDKGYRVSLANYSFADIKTCKSNNRLSPTLAGITHDMNDDRPYFPEFHLAKWFKDHMNQNTTIWAFHKTGARDLLEDYRLLIDHLQADIIILVDGGVDSLIRGNETETGTLIEDALSLLAVNDLQKIKRKILICTAMGAERDLAYNQIMENIANLTKTGGFIGSCSLVRQMKEYQLYENAVRYAQDQPRHDSSVINSSLISAVNGEFGNYHFTKKTSGSELNISPFMPIYWVFDLNKVTEQNYYLSQLRSSGSFWDAINIYMFTRDLLPARKICKLPLT